MKTIPQRKKSRPACEVGLTTAIGSPPSLHPPIGAESIVSQATLRWPSVCLRPCRSGAARPRAVVISETLVPGKASFRTSSSPSLRARPQATHPSRMEMRESDTRLSTRRIDCICENEFLYIVCIQCTSVTTTTWQPM